MHEIDKVRFGAFVAQLRQEKNMTQKDLAQRLFVSDKAVSKWERGLSLPDVGLLIPLGEALGVTVTELLEGQRLEKSESMSAEEAETLVQKALRFTDATARGGPDRKKWGERYCLCLVFTLAALGMLIQRMVHDQEHWDIYYPAAMLTGLSAGIGLYFCLFAKTRLPWYHDVDKIAYYYDGPFRIAMPGVRFNNRTWPHILRWVRVWSLLTMTLSGAVCCMAVCLFGPGNIAKWLPMVSLAGLLAAIYVPGKKYD